MKNKLITATVAAVVIGVTAACAPPQTSSQVWHVCDASYGEVNGVTTVDDALPKPAYPCLPAPPHRMDVRVPMNSNPTAATTRCYDLGGVPVGPYSAADLVLNCRTVYVA